MIGIMTLRWVRGYFWKAGTRRIGAIRIRGGNSASLPGGAGFLLFGPHAGDSGGLA
jgi:hypothetical protein